MEMEMEMEMEKDRKGRRSEISRLRLRVPRRSMFERYIEDKGCIEDNGLREEARGGKEGGLLEVEEVEEVDEAEEEVEEVENGKTKSRGNGYWKKFSEQPLQARH
ncbi:hypothetical protein HZH66_014899 [Vespula vulgaris]|uniref:Uncharacterized protein n=1 Tax=Vespula vulgaris TaxID=7454 RepID=A0A834IZ79_VESVU|nr:hypothetical protein HZH66_014899 [Vespula vulgaris]